MNLIQHYCVEIRTMLQNEVADITDTCTVPPSVLVLYMYMYTWTVQVHDGVQVIKALMHTGIERTGNREYRRITAVRFTQQIN